MERLRPYLMLSPALLIIVLFFLGGLGVGLMRSFNYMPIIGLTEPNLDAYVGILTDRTFLRSLGLTLYIAIASTAISMTLAIASGLLLRRSFRGKQVMTFLFQLNLPIPHIVGAIGILFLFTQGGFLARAAHAVHLIEQPADFPALVFDRYAIGIIAEYVWKEIPFIGVVVLAILQAVGDEYEALAQTLGANRWQRFRHVLLPLILPGVLSVSVIVLAFTLGAYEIPFMLGRSFPQALPVLAVRSYTDPDLNQRPQAMAMAIVITVLSTLLILAYMELSRRIVRKE
ncbi:MAG: sugar ABC transporter permease [Caldilineaceae bacterium]|nr:sugar ABC transporter permease [Caldilineaceae bacterium]